ncbi:MAG: hypothetical protein KBH99_07020 [Syntrophobacteraceae bacterium]|nr:hypothetical protein [Syntrophobacteraceae bacterium]
MKAGRDWAVCSLTWCFLLNVTLAGLFYYLGEQVLLGMKQWVEVLAQATPAYVPEEVRWAHANLVKVVEETREYLVPVVWGMTGLVTLLLWAAVFLSGWGYARKAVEEAASHLPPSTVSHISSSEEEVDPRGSSKGGNFDAGE